MPSAAGEAGGREAEGLPSRPKALPSLSDASSDTAGRRGDGTNNCLSFGGARLSELYSGSMMAALRASRGRTKVKAVCKQCDTFELNQNSGVGFSRP